MSDDDDQGRDPDDEGGEDLHKVVGDVLEEKLPSILEKLGFRPRGDEEPPPKSKGAPRTARDEEAHWEERVRAEVEKILGEKSKSAPPPEKPAGESAPEPPKTPWQERLWGGPKR